MVEISALTISVTVVALHWQVQYNIPESIRFSQRRIDLCTCISNHFQSILPSIIYGAIEALNVMLEVMR